MESWVDNFESQKEDKVYTPESLAWDLLFGEIDSDKKGLDQMIEFDNNNNDKTTKSDMLKDKYQILITIFMEMIFDLAKMDYYDSLEKNNKKSIKFIPKYKKMSLDAYISEIEEIFSEKLGFIATANIEDLTQMDDTDTQLYVDMMNKRYCRIALKYDNEDDDKVFEENDVPDDVYYHFRLNELIKKKYKIEYKKLDEIYSVFNLNDKVYRIHFSKL
jgi:hypothetical protein